MSTITPEQHLSLIRARCVELLEIAEKRTSGEWRQDACYVDRDGETFIKVPGNGYDSTFIASCAGAAEAGWKATIAAIDDLSPHPLNPNDNGRPCLCSMCGKVRQILAAWPLTLLQP